MLHRARAKFIALMAAIAVATVGILGYTMFATGLVAVAEQPDPLELHGPNVVDYNHKYPLADSRLQLITGTRAVEGTCKMSYRLALAPDEFAVEARETQFDPDTCTAIVEIGRPTEADVQQALDDASGGGQSESTELTDFNRTSFKPGGDTGAMVSSVPRTPDKATLSPIHDPSLFAITSQGYNLSWFRDPCQLPTFPCLTVNSVKNNIGVGTILGMCHERWPLAELDVV